jgi:mycothiol synthase
MVAEWNEVYNRSFAEHYHFVPSTVATLRERLTTQDFKRGAVTLASRGDACLGFCRTALHGRRGEIALLGVVPEARGLGLGRALLRWGVAWIERQDTDTVDLMVDGENESALALYRSEGFTVAATRDVWSRRPAAA